MNTKQVHILLAVLGVVVVFLGNSEVVQAKSKHAKYAVSPSNLRHMAVKQAVPVEIYDESDEDNDDVATQAAQTREILEEQFHNLEDNLVVHEQKIAAGERALSNLCQRASVLGHKEQAAFDKISELAEALARLEHDLEVMKKQYPQVSTNVNVVVGGTSAKQPEVAVPVIAAASSMSDLMVKLMSVVKCLGPSVINYYLVSKIIAAISENVALLIKATEVVDTHQAVLQNTTTIPSAIETGSALQGPAGYQLTLATVWNAAILLNFIYYNFVKKILKGTDTEPVLGEPLAYHGK